MNTNGVEGCKPPQANARIESTARVQRKNRAKAKVITRHLLSAFAFPRTGARLVCVAWPWLSVLSAGKLGRDSIMSKRRYALRDNRRVYYKILSD